jgi:hypothetical protein
MSAYGDHERKAISGCDQPAWSLLAYAQSSTVSGQRQDARQDPARTRGPVSASTRKDSSTSAPTAATEATGSDEFNQPDKGTRFVAAVFQITGVSGTATDDSNSDASLTGSNQQVYQANFSSIAGYTDFNSGDFNVTAGQSESGAVTFQVPSGVSVADIRWTVGIDNSAATWNVP